MGRAVGVTFSCVLSCFSAALAADLLDPAGFAGCYSDPVFAFGCFGDSAPGLIPVHPEYLHFGTDLSGEIYHFACRVFHLVLLPGVLVIPGAPPPHLRLLQKM
jgi:hypothetical protein